MTTLTPVPLSATDLLPLLPELVVIGGAFTLLIADLFISQQNKVWTHRFSIIVLLIALLMLITKTGGQGVVFHGMFIRDHAADIMKTVVLLVSALSLVYGWKWLREHNLRQGEIPVLLLFSTSGMMLLISAGSLLMVYLGLELLALCSYALVASDRENRLASEAGMKYIVLGSLASGLLLYGMSLVYGATGSLHLDVIRAASANSAERLLLITGAVFMVTGVAFKLGAAPFHMWLPDVYQGAPTPIALFISSAPKLAAFAMAWRLLETGIGPLAPELQYLLATLAALSLIVGNLMALTQTNIKRMLAYSTVSHIGFLLMGIAGGGEKGYSAAMFYAIAYALMSTASFAVIIHLSRAGFEAEHIDNFKGLNARNPWLAGLVLCIMASLAGVPPFLGFWSKLAVLAAAVNGGLLWLALLGVICAVIGCFYYLRIIKVMYFDEPDGTVTVERQDDRVLGIVLGVNAIALLLLPLFLGTLLEWMQKAFAHIS